MFSFSECDYRGVLGEGQMNDFDSLKKEHPRVPIFSLPS